MFFLHFLGLQLSFFEYTIMASKEFHPLTSYNSLIGGLSLRYTV